jgi:hypothetical protein
MPALNRIKRDLEESTLSAATAEANAAIKAARAEATAGNSKPAGTTA